MKQITAMVSAKTKTNDGKKTESVGSAMLSAFQFMLTIKTREEKNTFLTYHRKGLLPASEFNRYEELRQAELDHRVHVRLSYAALFPDREKCDHDYTKDEFYFFATILAFTYKLKEQLPQEVWQSELDRHFKAEPHHPEYEHLNREEDKRISDEDIEEMVIDRLSRNLQFSNSEYDDESIKQFEPTFLYDNDRRVELYRTRVKEYKDTVKSVWDEMKMNKKS